MQYVNDDMDELFRRAGENYPLDTSSLDWNKVLVALQDQNQPQIIPEKKGNKNGRFLWLLLLLPLGLICNQLYSPGYLKSEGVSKSDVAKEDDGTQNSRDHSKNRQPKNSQSTRSGIDQKNSFKESDIREDKDLIVPPAALPNSYSSKKQGAGNFVQKYNSSKNVSSRGPISETSRETKNLANQEVNVGRSYVFNIANRNELKELSLIVPQRDLTSSVYSSAPDEKPHVRITRTKKFYAGLMGGLDATTIKFQKIEDFGFNYGLLLGYQFNQKWGIETGAYLERKYYYSDGKYFNTSKIYLPPNTWIDDLSGYCKMIEVPLSAKYNFTTKKQSSWFGVVGLSSYFLLQENYTYNYYYGTVGPVPHSKEYKNNSTHLFANVGVSGGYTHTLGNFADVRVEPYLRIPISGMGIGNVPLFSTGLQIGVTKKF